MDKRSSRPAKPNKRMMNLSRLIRLLILIFMILIMMFLFMIARILYMNQHQPAVAEASLDEAEDTPASSPADTPAPESQTDPPQESTEKTSYAQAFTIGEIETGDVLYTDPPETPEPPKGTNLSSGRILIGDSRFAYWPLQQIALDPGDILIAKGGEYFTWFRDEAVPQLIGILDRDPNYDVIINMGLNDCANNIRGGTLYFTPDYIAMINDLYVRYPTTAFYFASIGPIKSIYPSIYGNIKKEDLQLYIDIFNYAMRTQCSAEYIELGEYLYDGAPTYVDNVHYDAVTDQRIYEFIKAHVRTSVYDP